ncbi:YybH family protein [Flavihumibacter profundi]|uniref:YybH family protein n=1 Tax=Flavihumibacter profundi TaxID=2716883 RepID=UPI001CC44879|nr:nuclear transport factor 2 family protein [Flavihumibacter profundi]MBZ5857853.1 nuclear transport factor 2 family protein [Flavihumibacter profundi]
MKALFLGLVLLVTSSLFAQQNAENAIRQVMGDQQDAWNQGDIESFMKGYWKSDSLMFIGSKGVTYGFRNTWERYKKTYDNRDKMGTLKFDLLHILPLSPEVYMVVGKWHLTRSIGDIGGHFTLIFRKINGQWLITSDHTS